MRSTSEFDEITVFGARGHSLLILRAMQEHWQGRVSIRALVDDVENGFIHPSLDIPVISSCARLHDYADIPVMLTPASAALRRDTALRLAEEGAILATAHCYGMPHVDPAVTYGPGCVVAPMARLGANIVVGAGAQVLCDLVAHDVVIGAYSTLNATVSVLGHVIIGEGVNIAPNAVIGNGTRERPLMIGDGAVIGVGAVVVRDVESGAKMVGNPAMTVERWKKFSRLLDAH